MKNVTLAGTRYDEEADAESAHRICQEPRRAWERIWQWGSERLNPIVVKEVRQSLKSRQFEVSFGLMLTAAVGWTLLYMSFAVPRIFYVPTGGAELLNGYAIILLVPLLIVIPFSAFRSLTSEVEENTFELLSITSLSARQIVTGKMATAAVQILLYVSALAPCIVLTYMLRGVSLFSIAMMLGAAVAYSVMFVSCALMVATVSKTRAGQSGMSVLLLSALVLSFFFCTATLTSVPVALLFTGVLPREISIAVFAVVTVLAALFSLMMQTAAAALDFASENKSTPIRWRLLVLISTVLFWYALGMVAKRDELRDGAVWLTVVLQIGFFLFWTLIGALICGERGIISPRARRTLPATFAGRALLTWLTPGSGLGFVYLITVYGCFTAFVTGVCIFVGARGGPADGLDAVPALGALLTCYLAIYVGLTRLVMLVIGRRGAAPMVLSFSIMVVLNLLLQLVPYAIVLYLNDFTSVAFEWHQIFNVYLAIRELLTSGTVAILGNLIAISLAALTVFGLNLLLSTKDVMILRIAVPERVLKEKGRDWTTTPAAVDPFLN